MTTLCRKEKIEAHLALAREHVQRMNAQAMDEEKLAKRVAAARRRAARQRMSRLEAALREVERLQQEKKHDRDQFVARASSSDPEAHVMRNGEGGTVPSLPRDSDSAPVYPGAPQFTRASLLPIEAEQRHTPRMSLKAQAHPWQQRGLPTSLKIKLAICPAQGIVKA